MSFLKTRTSVRLITASSIFAITMAASPAFAMTDYNQGGGGYSPVSSSSFVTQVDTTVTAAYNSIQPVVARVFNDLQTVVFIYQAIQFFGSNG